MAVHRDAIAKWITTLGLLALELTRASADEGASSNAEPERPAIGFFRWQEDWSVLADPRVAHEPGDILKYIPLSSGDPKRYLSFGITLRERIESNDAPSFGAAGTTHELYLIHRLELHADAHFTDATRAFVELENALSPGLSPQLPPNANKLDLRLAFLDWSGQIGGGLLQWRLGRQEIAFDLQRFVSVRDGPNVRQAYDALWSAYDLDRWRLSAFASHPVQYENNSAFDDYSNRHFTYGGVRLHRDFGPEGGVAVTFSEYRNDDAHFLAASGPEHRHNWDIHYNGSADGLDWDVEGVEQRGAVAEKSVSAWAFGSLAGYTWVDRPWRPRVGLQLDAASGTHNLTGQDVGTFNPLFPNGYYLTQSGYTGYANFLHVKPSLTLRPEPDLTLLAAVGGLWRQTTEDAVYTIPDTPVPHTAGEPGRYSATYLQVRGDYTATRSLAFALEANYYDVASVIRQVGGHDSLYFGFEGRWGW
jgi:hypothetical protein